MKYSFYLTWMCNKFLIESFVFFSPLYLDLNYAITVAYNDKYSFQE